MNLAALSLTDFIGVVLGLTLTLMVFSYVFGDNALFRMAVHIFIGVASGYAAVAAVYTVIWPRLLEPLIFGSADERLFILLPLLLSGLLLFKVTPRLSWVGNAAVGYLVGVGAAAVVGGAVLGTILPQAGAAIAAFGAENISGAPNPPFALLKASIVLVGALSTLIYFQYGARKTTNGQVKRSEWIEAVAWIGQIFIAITLGVIFAGVYAAALTAFIERLAFLTDFILPLISG
jgi:hypothetical protein